VTVAVCFDPWRFAYGVQAGIRIADNGMILWGDFTNISMRPDAALRGDVEEGGLLR
jgi:hypothetical protein